MHKSHKNLKAWLGIIPFWDTAGLFSHALLLDYVNIKWRNFESWFSEVQTNFFFKFPAENNSRIKTSFPLQQWLEQVDVKC